MVSLRFLFRCGVPGLAALLLSSKQTARRGENVFVVLISVLLGLFKMDSVGSV